MDADRGISPEAAGRAWATRYWADLVWGALVCILVGAAFVVPHFHLGGITPVIDQTAQLYRVLGGTAPILGQWMPHDSWASPCAVAIAVAVVVWGPSMAQRLPWRHLVAVVWLVSTAWAMDLALIDGWSRGFVGRMGGHQQYLSEIPRAGSVSNLLHGFAARIVDGQPGSWDIDVAGHPVGALLTFVGLQRVGLGGPVWAGLFCVVVGSSSAAAVVIAVRALDGESMARRIAPFVAMAPAAIWIAVSADAYFAGAAAWGLTLLALAATKRSRFPAATSVAAGALLAWCIYLNYGLVLMGVPAVAVVVIARNYRPLIGAAAGGIVVVITITAAGFWWFDGLSLLRHRYWAGIAMDRPFVYWSWANLASLTCAIGLAAATALRRAFATLRARRGFNVLLASFVVAILLADASALSKAETERIWLPFAVWLVSAPGLLPRSSHRFCLGVQAVGALLINSLVFTTW